MTCMVSDIFDIRYGHSLELNALNQVPSNEGVAFVSRKMGNNGVSAYVAPIDNISPASAGEISCAMSGNGVLTTYIQETDFYCGYHVAILSPKISLTRQQILFYCDCIKMNRYRYNYGRQANRTLSEILIPSINQIPDWVDNVDIDFDKINAVKDAVSQYKPNMIESTKWRQFRYDDLFEIKRGGCTLNKNDMKDGDIPFVSATSLNNGHSKYVNENPIHNGNVITVSNNGSIGEAFYQPKPFLASSDVSILRPKNFNMNNYIAMFLCTIIKLEQFRYCYGRKWGVDLMNKSIMRLPADSFGEPDWKVMEEYIKSLPYSKSV